LTGEEFLSREEFTQKRIFDYVILIQQNSSREEFLIREEFFTAVEFLSRKSGNK